MKISSVITFLLLNFLLPFTSTSQEPKLILPIGHTLGVGSAVFSPDGKRMVTSALDNTAKIWDVETGQLLANLRGHTDTLFMAAFSPDGKKIVTCSEDGTVKIWDAISTLLLADLTGNCGKIYNVEFSPDGKKITAVCENAAVTLWEVSSGKLLATLSGHRIALNYISFSRDGKKIATAADDSTAKIWDTESGKLLIDFKNHSNAVWSAEFSPDGKKIITASTDSTIKIWDAVTGNILKDIKGHTAPVKVAHFSPDGKKIISASDEGDVKLWNAETGILISNIKGKAISKTPPSGFYPDNVSIADFSPDGKKILTVYNRDSSAKIWDAATGILLKEIKRKYGYVNTVSFSKDGKKFSLALAGGTIELYDMVKGDLLVNMKGDANRIQGFEFSRDGKRILVQNWFGSAKILDAATGTLVATLPSNKDSKQGVIARYSPDGKKVLATDFDSTAKVYDVATGTLLLTLKGKKEKISWSRFSPDGKKIYTSSNIAVKIWDAATGTLLVDLKEKGHSFNNYQISQDGAKIVTTAFQDTIAKVLNTENGQLIAELKVPKNLTHSNIISPSGEKILTASLDGTTKIFDAKTGIALLSLKEPNSRVRHADFSPDEKRIAISAQNLGTKITTAKVFDAATGTLVAELKQPGESMRWNVFYSPDRKKILGSMENGSINIWDAESGAFLLALKGLNGRVFINDKCFSPDGKKIVAGDNDGLVKIWNLETGTALADLKEHNFSIQSAVFSPDGGKVITISDDFTAKVWDAETGNSLYTFIAVDKDDYLVIDKNNHYDGTEAGRKLLYFTCGTEVIELEQLKDQLWVPNLAERILNGETINAAKLSDLNICNLTPVVDTIVQTASHYRFRITPRLGGLGATIVTVNGIEVKRYTPQQLQLQKSDYLLSIDKKEVHKFFVTNKENNISVKSLTAKNSISSRSVSINEKGIEKSAALPNLYAIVVGVSDYKGDGLDLKFAAKDAVDMAKAIDASAKKLLNTDGKEHVFIYKVHTAAGRDKFPEKNSIRQVFTEVSSKAQPNDILMIFFAGHGVLESEKNQFYFLTADASNLTVSGALKNVGISTEELADWIKPQVMKAQKRILIFDACNSGQAIKEIIAFNQTGQNLMAARNDDKGKQTKAIEKLNERSGMFILSASASDQKAYEMGKYNQGVLTYSLLRAIKEQPDILEDRQYLNISRWFNAAEKSVNELARETGARQQPQLVSTTNFNIGVVDEEVRNNIVLPFEKPMFTRSDFRNTELRVDNLKLRTLVDKQLSNISDNSSSATIMYSPEYDGVNVYAISGDYTVTGNEISISVILTKGGTEIKTRFEVKGLVANPEGFSRQITATVVDWLKNH